MLALKNNTEYIAIFRMLIGSDTSVYLHLFNNNWGFVKNFSSNLSPTKNYIKFTTPSSSEIKHLQLENKGASSFDITDVMVIEYQEGMENWDIPYFNGMTSVKAPVLHTVGKNLFDYKDFKRVVENGGETSLYPINLKSNTTYTFSDETGQWNGCGFFLEVKDENNNLVAQIINSNLANRKSFTFTTNSSKQFYLYMFKNTIEKMDSRSSNFQIEEGSTSTTYEPYKSNILTTPEDLELRGIGNIKDELNISTGEKVERIGEVVFDGSDDEKWFMVNEQDIYTNKRFRTDCLKEKMLYSGGDVCNIICDKVVCYPNSTWRDDREGIEQDSIFLSFRKNCETITEFKQYLSQNPITVQYKLNTPILYQNP